MIYFIYSILYSFASSLYYILHYQEKITRMNEYTLFLIFLCAIPYSILYFFIYSILYTFASFLYYVLYTSLSGRMNEYILYSLYFHVLYHILFFIIYTFLYISFLFYLHKYLDKYVHVTLRR